MNIGHVSGVRAKGRGHVLAYKATGILLVVIGSLLLSAAGGYWIFQQVAKAGLDDQNVSIPLETPQFPNTFERPELEEWTATQAVDQTESQALWPIPRPDQYFPVDWLALPNTVGVLPQARWISIPAIGVRAPVVDLNTVWEDGKLVWERPVNAVGHHIGTPHPGEFGNTVVSGHRSSPLRGEGSVFRKLGDVPNLLLSSSTSDEHVDIFLHTPDTVYIYRAVSTQVVEPGQVNVFHQTAEPTLTLITCTPDLVYSHRLIVTAWLVATAPA